MPRWLSLMLLLLAWLAPLPRPAGATPPPSDSWGAAAPPAGGVAPTDLCRAAILQAEREAGLPQRLLVAIGRVEPGRRDPQGGGFGPYPWTINAEGRGSFYPDKAAAIAAVRALQAEGVRSIDVGCMQVNLRHHPTAFASLEEAFDPLANARYAARFLTELQSTGPGDWMRAAGHYHNQTPERAEGYRTRVAAAWEAERGNPAAPPASAFAALHQPPPGVAGGGAPMLNRSMAGRAGGGAMVGSGRGLDAYRAMPIALIGRPLTMPAQRVAMVAPSGVPPGVPIGAAAGRATASAPTGPAAPLDAALARAMPGTAAPDALRPAAASAPASISLFSAPRPAGPLFPGLPARRS